MKIHVYTSESAPAARRHVAYIETAVDLPVIGGEERKALHFVPMSFWGSTEADAIASAERYWRGELDNETRRNENRKAQSERAKAARVKGGDADG